MHVFLPCLAVAALVLMSGCATWAQDRVVAPPPVAQVNGKPLSIQVPCPAALDTGQTCIALVNARNWYSDTGIRVKPAESYCIRIPRGQVWFDAGRPSTPPDGEPGNLLMNLFKWLKRHDLPWFTLMAAVVGVDQPGIAPDLTLASQQSQNLAQDRRLEVKSPGALVLYPNDARGPASRLAYFYGNNSGQIRVQVSRLQASQACTDDLVP